jgi:hypothetical protein
LTALARHVQFLWLLGPTLGVMGALSAIWPLWLKRRAQRKEIRPGYLACGMATAIMATFALHFAVAAIAVQSWLFALAGVGCIMLAVTIGLQLPRLAH